MSSVSGADPKARADESAVVKRNRKENKSNEAELKKRQQAELRRISENFNREIESLKEQHAKQLSDIRNATNDAINERDHKYQQESEEMRGLYRKQLEAQASEAQAEKNIYRRTTEKDMRAQKQNSEQNLNKTREVSRNNLETKDKVYGEAIQNLQKEQKETIERFRENLTKAHQEEADGLRKERDDMRADMQGKYDRYRENAEGRLERTEIKAMQDQKNMSDSHLHSTQRERKLRDENEQNLMAGFKDGMDLQKDRYHKALESNQKTFNSAYEKLQDDVSGRINGKMRQLELENTDLKSDNVINEQKRTVQGKRTEDNIKRAAQDNIRDLDEQRQGAIRDGADRLHKTASEMRKEQSELMVRTNRAYREQLDEQGRIHRQAHAQLKGDFDGRIEQNNLQTNQRIKNMIEETQLQKSQVIEVAQENNLAQRRQSLDEVRGMRNKIEDDRNQTLESMRGQMRKQELQHAERIDQVVSKYEKEINQLKDQQLREKRLADEKQKRTIEDLQRAHKLEMEQVLGASNERVRQLQEQQRSEIQAVNKRQDARVEAVLAEVKKQNKV